MDIEDLGEKYLVQIGDRRSICKWNCCFGCCVFLVVGLLSFIIGILASIHTIDSEEQIVMNTATDKRTIDGPTITVLDPFRGKEYRKATRLDAREFAVVMDKRDGKLRHALGPTLLFLGAWEEIQEVRRTTILQQQEYLRLVDRWTGVERIVSGPVTFAPAPLEYSPEGIQRAVIIGTGMSVVTVDSMTGVKTLVVQEGVFTPAPYESILETRMPVNVGHLEYAVLRDLRTGELRHVHGPVQLQVGAYEELVAIHDKIVLQNDEYIRFVDHMTGLERVARGPETIVPGPAEQSELGVEQAFHIGAENAILVDDHTAGEMELITTEGVFAPGPHVTVVEMRYAHVVGPYEYATMRNLLTGELLTIEGPSQIRVGAYEELVGIQPKVVLQFDEYIRLVDQMDGTERVEIGPQTLVPLPTEVAPFGVEEAFFITHEHKLIVLDRTTATRRIVHDQGVFTPAAYVDILEQRSIIRVMPAEAIVVRNSEGSLVVQSGMDGNGTGTSFFLEPYDEVFVMTWTDYSTPGAVGSKQVSRIDLRRSKMYFEYVVRTKDQVVLALEGIIFWQIIDVHSMVRTSADPEGDVWYRARSTFIAEVSKVTLQEFMENFNMITQAAFAASSTDTFFSDRGVLIDTMEVTKYDTVDEETSDVLMEIIRENTRRTNLETEQETEAYLARQSMEADIYLETNRTNLLTIQGGNQELEAELAGRSVGLFDLSEVQTIIDGLDPSVPTTAERVDIYKLKEDNRRGEIDIENYASMDLHLVPYNMTLLLGSHTAATREEL